MPCTHPLAAGLLRASRRPEGWPPTHLAPPPIPPPLPPPPQDLDVPEHRFACDPTEEGRQVLRHIQRAVFGGGSLREERSFAECAFMAPLAQVGAGCWVLGAAAANPDCYCYRC